MQESRMCKKLMDTINRLYNEFIEEVGNAPNTLVLPMADHYVLTTYSDMVIRGECIGLPVDTYLDMNIVPTTKELIYLGYTVKEEKVCRN